MGRKVNTSSTLYVRVDRSALTDVTQIPYTTSLSVDGGGLRGVIPVVILMHLETTIKHIIVKNLERLHNQKALEYYKAPEDKGDSVTFKDFTKLDKDWPVLQESTNGTLDYLYHADRFNFEIWLADYFDVLAGKYLCSALRLLQLSRRSICNGVLRTSLSGHTSSTSSPFFR